VISNMKNIILAKMLLILLKEHKAHCVKQDCGISVFLFKPLYEQLIGRKATSSEFRKYFL